MQMRQITFIFLLFLGLVATAANELTRERWYTPQSYGQMRSLAKQYNAALLNLTDGISPELASKTLVRFFWQPQGGELAGRTLLTRYGQFALNELLPKKARDLKSWRWLHNAICNELTVTRQPDDFRQTRHLFYLGYSPDFTFFDHASLQHFDFMVAIGQVDALAARALKRQQLWRRLWEEFDAGVSMGENLARLLKKYRQASVTDWWQQVIGTYPFEMHATLQPAVLNQAMQRYRLDFLNTLPTIDPADAARWQREKNSVRQQFSRVWKDAPLMMKNSVAKLLTWLDRDLDVTAAAPGFDLRFNEINAATARATQVAHLLTDYEQILFPIGQELEIGETTVPTQPDNEVSRLLDFWEKSFELIEDQGVR